MLHELTLTSIIDEPDLIYDLEGFAPGVVDATYLASLGVRVIPAAQTLDGLARGSEALAQRLKAKTLLPRPRVIVDRIDLDSELEIHNYTGACPRLTYEMNPVVGCRIGCLYCLVTDGSHEPEMTLWENYPALVEKVLETKHQEPHFFYFSPKTEPFAEPTLQTGVAHDILRVFIEHFEKHPQSQARLFIASKAGARHLSYQHKGQSVLDLFERLSGRMQFNTSVSNIPAELRPLLEPFAAPFEERLEAVQMCRDRGITANSALVQPLLTPYLDVASTRSFFEQLADVGIINYKPEFLTVDPESLAIIGQIVGRFDKVREKQLYEVYIDPNNRDHKKQRCRTAPDKKLCTKLLGDMMQVTNRLGMSTSICYWVRKELGISEETIPIINRNGFQCLGYQTRLFDAT